MKEQIIKNKSMHEELEVLKIVTHRLNKANIAYMISGSIAANYYTVPRMTRDIDVIVELKSSDVDKFVSLFEGDFYIDREMVKKEVLQGGTFNLIHNQYVIKIDFIVRKDSRFQNTTFSRRKKVLIENNPMWFISAEDLILAKLHWTKDSHDTHPAIATQFQKLMRMKSNTERLLMGCSMFDTAKQIAKDAIFNQNPEITPKSIKEEIFLRFYGTEFSKAEKDRILDFLRSTHE